MLSETFLLECLSVLILLQLLQISCANRNPQCNPSACGRIHNISYPFRLKGDPKRCGDSSYELVCENNTASLYLNSHRYHVKSINYHNFTIHLVDAALKNDTCSFPQYSMFRYNLSKNYPYSIYAYNSTYRSLNKLNSPITFMSCPYPVNSSFFLETAHCGNRVFDSNDSTRRYTYVNVGNLNASDVRDMCSIDLIVMTSWPFKDVNHLSLSDIHSSLLYGFELSWFTATISRCKKEKDCNICSFTRGSAHFCSGFSINYMIYVIYGFSKLLPLITAINLLLRILIAIPFVLVLLVYKLRRRHISMFKAIEDFLRSQNNLMPISYSYSEIKKMTKSFREKIGEGGYGSVYKGKLRSGRDVAVKILGKNKSNGQDFINEVTTTGRIHHVNIVRLVGYCADMSKCALLYDFMPNGSLEKYISCQQGGTHSLTWEKKHAITLGVARGIEYLHRGCDMRILHFDIKPHNILLDDNFTPKISDFGLARSYPTGNSIVTITAARGTIGYVAPELINRGIGAVSHKADVYSFGMLLMEMLGLTRDLIQNTELSSQYFPDWIYDRFNEGKDLEIGDADESGCEEMKITRKMTIVALWCIQMNPLDRPSMSKVMEMLESEVETLQIPPQPCQPPIQVAPPEDQMWGSDSTDSIALLCNASSLVN
ncbi:LEAF RUST 10 DISEASE-RESISTANCE LOCUS RECEPTOR-LIKE PROTEIN KINASE-like 2.4 [Olea europaea var. sylvestris]|uniref:LEAF RUST 10 DISEASE-RESISTANCE LOCUS RECEPTOR-LIKE PROTEIN KINASE-like 2.4 n=1 Tax=Olea europaea var. sylvestris TaxID=158386 RepID=UPI000C1CD37C|nr:LEAF RUST 10 DISEASE-RESISTANCE LOCUS RECEPTOR-LIKE PROTEIN KINASE-like 2.4 [Olea europaea var. sylvestris]